MRITIDEVKENLGVTETYDIINAVRNSASPQFQQYVPLANADNVAEVGAGIMLTQAIQNEFITSLVDRIGLVVISQVQLQNQLKPFKKGQMPQGRTIEQIFVDIAKEHKYDPETAEEEVFKREIPHVKTLFHERNRQGFYKQSIQDESLRTAFISWGQFGDFLSGIINAMYNSAEVDEYKYMKMLVDNYYSKGLFKIEKMEKPDTETLAREFVKKARAVSTKMTLPQGTRDYNALAVHTRTDPNDLYLLIDADLNATVDVDVLAKAFNMDKSDFMGRVIVMDGFASTGLEAVLIDRDWFMVYDQLIKMETILNPQGLYWNYNYHVWQVLSASRFHNAVAFVSDDSINEVTQVIVDPVVASIKPNRTMTLNSFVRTTDGQDYPVTWAVEQSDGSSVSSGTSINEDGKLTVGGDESGELRVTATVSVDPDDNADSGDEYDVVGESLIAIIPE